MVDCSGRTSGVAGATRSYQQEFNKYRGLFDEQGDFDIPASLQAGVAVDITKDLTLLADYKHIWYSQIASINNPSTNPPPSGQTMVQASAGVTSMSSS